MRLITALGFTILSLAATAQAGDDPNIPSERKVLVRQAMSAHVDDALVSDHYVIYDAVDGKLLRLQFKELHTGVVRKGEFFVACADFTNAAGTLIDVDFLVAW